MKKLIIYIIFVTLLSSVVLAGYVKDHNNCPTSYLSQDCASGKKACGYTSNVLYCDYSATVNASLPGGSATVSTNNYDAGLGGGYVLDCLKNDITCIPWVCQRDASCFNVNRQTTCTGGTTTFTCDVCISGYNYCDGNYTDINGCEIDIDTTPYPGEANAVYNSSCGPKCSGGYLDCNGNLGSVIDGCEILDGGSCSVAGIPGIWSGCSCVITPQHHITGTEAKYSSILPNLWTHQFGSGVVANFSNASNASFIIDQNLCIVFADGSVQCNATGGGVSGDYVPYVGANKNVDLNNKNLSSGGLLVGNGSVFTKYDLADIYSTNITTDDAYTTSGFATLQYATKIGGIFSDNNNYMWDPSATALLLKSSVNDGKDYYFMDGLFIEKITKSGGTIASIAGIYIEDQDAATDNYGIVTNKGYIYHGDKVKINPSASYFDSTLTPTEALEVVGNANITGNVTVGDGIILNGTYRNTWPEGNTSWNESYANTLYYDLASDNATIINLVNASLNQTYVPYSGATKSVNLNGKNLTNVSMVNVTGTLYASNVSSNSPLQLQTSGVTRIFVNDTTGYVGVGITTPNSGLQVVGGLTQDSGMNIINRVVNPGRKELFASGNSDGIGSGAVPINTWMTPYMTNYSINGYGSSAFIGALFDGQNIWLIPYFSDYLVKVNPATGAMINYSVTSYGDGVFAGGVFDGQNIWLIPYYADYLVKVNPANGQMTNYLCNYTDSAFWGGVFDGQNIWLIPSDADYLVKVNPANGQMTNYSHGLGNSAFKGGVFDGQNIWLIPYNTASLVKVNPATGAMTYYTHGYGASAFRGGAFDGQNVWLFPRLSNYLVKLNPATGTMTNYSVAGYGAGAFSGGVFDGQNIWLIPSGISSLVKVNPANGQMTNYSHTYGINVFSGGLFDGQNIWLIPADINKLVKFRPQEFGVESLFTNGVLNVGGYLADRRTIGTSTINGNLNVLNGNVFVKNNGSTNIVASFESANLYGSIIAINATGVNGGEFDLITTANGVPIGGGKFAIMDRKASSYRFIIDGLGNIGMGTAATPHKLNVNGSVNVTNTVYADQFCYQNETCTAGQKFVPYTGATQDVDLGNNSLQVGKAFIFNTLTKTTKFSGDVVFGNLTKIVYTVGIPTGLNAGEVTGNTFGWNGYFHTYHIYSYRIVGGERFYSAGYNTTTLYGSYCDSCSITYDLNVTWNVVSGADGYRVLVDNDYNYPGFNYYYDTTTNNLIDNATYIYGSAVTPSSPYTYVSQNENVFFIYNSTTKDIGIGTATPTQKLDVNGSVNVTDTVYADSFCYQNGTCITGGATGDYVPYTGANKNVDLNNKSLINVSTVIAGNNETALALLVQDGAVMFNGTLDGPGKTPTNGSGVRLMWIPAKAAFREGMVEGDQWDDANMGYYSFSVGENTIASGAYSSALGYNSSATGNYSFAVGNFADSSGLSAFSSGTSTLAVGNYSTAFGLGSTAVGLASYAAGNLAVAGYRYKGEYTFSSKALNLSGNQTDRLKVNDTLRLYYIDGNGYPVASYSSIESNIFDGNNTLVVMAEETIGSDKSELYAIDLTSDKISSAVAIALGTESTSSGVSSIAIGYKSTATEQHSVAIGRESIASAEYATAIGYANKASGNYSSSFGVGTSSSGVASMALGAETNASGLASTAMGYLTNASGNYSLATGYNTTAYGEASAALGKDINVTTDETLGISGRIGIGTGSPNQALQVVGNANISGNVTAEQFCFHNGTCITGGATGDYVPYTGANKNVDLNNKSLINVSTVIAGNNETALALLVNDGAVMFNGTLDGPGKTPTNGSGVRLMWIPAKAAFREGMVEGDQWNDENIGYYSFSVGENTIASGAYSSALGYNSSATGNYSFAVGNLVNASNFLSIAMGTDVISSGYAAVALGVGTTASNASALAVGTATIASGEQSTALGHSTEATAHASTAMGFSTLASGEYSTAMGYNSEATGNTSTAIGNSVTASAQNAIALGVGFDCQQENATCIGGGNVGIGTGVPNQALQVVGNANISGNVTAEQFCFHNGTCIEGVNVSGYVPYTGATQDVDLGNNDLQINNLFFFNSTGGNVRFGNSSAQTYTVDDVTNAVAVFKNSGGSYNNNPGGTWTYRIYAYREIGGIRFYSAGYNESNTATDDGSGTNSNSINVTWDAVPNATGYRLLFNNSYMGWFDYDRYYDVSTNNFIDTTPYGFYTYDINGPVLTPTSPYILIPAFFYDTIGNVGIGTLSPTDRLEVNGSIKANSFNGNWNGSVNYVPYSGATQNVNLGNQQISSSGRAQFGNTYYADLAYDETSTGNLGYGGYFSSYNDYIYLGYNDTVNEWAINAYGNSYLDGNVNVTGNITAEKFCYQNGTCLEYVNSSSIGNTYVPYSGATANVDLNNKSIVNISRIGIGTDNPESALQINFTNTSFRFKQLEVSNILGNFSFPAIAPVDSTANRKIGIEGSFYTYDINPEIVFADSDDGTVMSMNLDDKTFSFIPLIGNFSNFVISMNKDGSKEFFRISAEDNETRFNQYNLPMDFRVKSQNDPNMLFINGREDKIGIGTNVLTQKMDVNGSVNVTGNITADQFCFQNGTCIQDPNMTGYVPYQGAVQDVNLGVNNLSTNGSITTSYLNISNPSSATTVLAEMYMPNLGDDSYAYLKLGKSPNTDEGAAIYYKYNSSVQTLSISHLGEIETNGISIVNGGNVGIGTYATDKRLTVGGDVNVTGTIYAHNFSGNSPVVFINSSGDEMLRIEEEGGLTFVGGMNVKYHSTENNYTYSYNVSNSPRNNGVVDCYNPSSTSVAWVLNDSGAITIIPFSDNGVQFVEFIGTSQNIGDINVFCVDVYNNSIENITINTNMDFDSLKAYLDPLLTLNLSNIGQDLPGYSFNPGTHEYTWVGSMIGASNSGSTTWIDPPVAILNMTLVGSMPVVAPLFVVNSSTGNIGVRKASPTYALDVNGNANVEEGISLGKSDTALALLVREGAVMFNGTFGGPGVTPTAGGGVRLMWIPNKAAFREGMVANGEWDDANVGDYSFSIGQNTLASAPYSNALGYNSSAIGNYSFAVGNMVESTGLASFASGSQTYAGEKYSTALGFASTAAGRASYASGNFAVAGYHYYGNYSSSTKTITMLGNNTGKMVPGDMLRMRYQDINSEPVFSLPIVDTIYFDGTYTYINITEDTIGSDQSNVFIVDLTLQDTFDSLAAVSIGTVTVASGLGSIAMGFGSQALGSVSTSIGLFPIASGMYSTAIGAGVNATGDYSVALGRDISCDQENATCIGGGNVGIGIGEPAQKLHVNGSVNVTSNTYSSQFCLGGVCIGSWDDVNQSTGGESLWTNSSGNATYTAGRVGIGTVTPDATLHINSSSGALIIASNDSGTVFKVENSGEAFSDVGFSTPATDVAERIPVKGDAEEGDVVVIYADEDEMLIKSTKAYDRLVAGVVSTNPGIRLGEEGEYIALTGRVPVKVIGEVNRGDLLVTSDEPGKAMSCVEKERCTGAVLGKAMTENKDGQVIALISLQ